MSPQQVGLKAGLVIIGGGGSGLAAALTAAEHGLTDIVILEKRGGLGGNTARATGLFACESPTQARQKIVADRDELFQKAMLWAHWTKINPRIVRAFLNKSGDTVRWLEEMGLEFQVIAFFPNQNPRVEHVASGKGVQVTQVMSKRCQELGVKILLNTAAQKVLVGEDRKVYGVRATRHDGDIEIQTENVIIASGGFSGNQDLLRKYCPDYYEGMPVRGIPLNGDGLLMAAEAGSAIEDMATLLKEGPRINLNSWPLGGLEREPVTMWINCNGQRFVDESLGSHPFEAVNAILLQPERVCYTLLDESICQLIAQKIPGLEVALQKEVARHRVKKSSSWAEIAKWVGADAGVLTSSVAEYNFCCGSGYDASFAKDRRYLFPLQKAPFYAIRGRPHLLDTIGGIRINEQMQVLDKTHKPIPGLFAAGVATSGWESETYCSDLSGSAFGYAVNSGRIAGENAASGYVRPQ